MNAAVVLRRALSLLVAVLANLLPCVRAQDVAIDATANFTAVPAALHQVNGAYPQTHVVLLLKSCEESVGGVIRQLTASSYDVQVSGMAVTADNVRHDKCTVSFDLKTVSTEHGTAVVEVRDDKETLRAFLDFVDPAMHPVPTRPKVDVLWGLISTDVCKRAFGKAVAERFYCIAMKVGNNSGYALKIAGVGFRSRYVSRVRCSLVSQDSAGVNDSSNKSWCNPPSGPPTKEDAEKTPSSSYLLTRAILQDGAPSDWRSLTLHSMGATGLLMAGFAPYFHSQGASARFGTATSIVSAPLQAAFNLLFPDPTFRQQNNLDDQSLKETTIISNNAQISTVVFLDKGSVSFSFREPCWKLFPVYNRMALTEVNTRIKAGKLDAYDRDDFKSCLDGTLSSGVKEALGT